MGRKALTLIIVSILICLYTSTSVFAQASEVTVDAGTNNEMVDIGNNSNNVDEEGNIISHTFSFGGPMLDTANFKVFDMEPLIRMYKNAIAPLTPQVLQNNTIKNTKGYKISGSGQICTTNFFTGQTDTKKTDKYVTAENTDLKDLDESVRPLASYWTGYKQFPDANKQINQERTPITSGDPPPCGANEIGDLQSENVTTLTKPWIFGFFSRVFDLLSWNENKPSAFLVSKQLNPYSEVFSNLHYGSGSDVQYLTKVDPNGIKEVENVQNSGGVSRTIFPGILDETKGKGTASHQNTLTSGDGIKTSFTDGKASEVVGTSEQCMLLPAVLQNVYIRKDPTDTENTCEIPEQMTCDSKFFKQFDLTKISPGKDADPGYTIPYRNSSCTPNNTTKAIAIALASNGFNGGSVAAKNLNAYWQDIIDTSKKYGWNPMFVLTLWIEESAAGGHPNAGWHLGCLYGWNKNGSAETMEKLNHSDAGKPGSICDQMACLFSHPVKGKDDFGSFMCSYNTTAQSNGQCPSASNWEFADTIKTVYSRLVSTVQSTQTGGNCGFTRL